jgi:hypothetical protein
MVFFEWLAQNYQELISIVVAGISLAILIAQLIPGKEPEKTLYKIIAFIEKFSKK